MMDKTVYIEGVGDVQLTLGRKARTIRILLSPFAGVRVSVPRHASMRQVVDFVQAKRDWIAETRRKMQCYEANRTVFTPETEFCTATTRLQLVPWHSGSFISRVSGGILHVFYPQNVNLQAVQAQDTIKKYIIAQLRKEAQQYLPARTEQLAQLHGFAYHGVSVKHITSRWGSCSAANHINLSIHLMRLPEELRDYIILHELTHTIHKNHAPRFWQHLDSLTNGKAKLLAASMKRFHTELL